MLIVNDNKLVRNRNNLRGLDNGEVERSLVNRRKKK